MIQCSYKAEEIIYVYLFFVLQIPYICKDKYYNLHCHLRRVVVYNLAT